MGASAQALKPQNLNHQGHTQFAVAWDPSGSVNVAIIQSPQRDDNYSAYLPIQEIEHLTIGQTHDDYKALLANKEAERTDSFAEMRSLSNAIHSIKPGGLSNFLCPAGLLARPVGPTEVRIQLEDGSWAYYATVQNTCMPECSLSDEELFDISFLISTSDRGPLPTSSMNFVVCKLGALVLQRPDENHQKWGDVKAASQKSRCKIWRTILGSTLVYNLNYGPFGSSA